MGQKVHPLGFRLGITKKHQSYWCTKPRLSALWVDDASFIRRFIQKTYTGAGITLIEINRSELDCSSIDIKIYAARPALFSGRDLKSLDSLRDQLINKLKAFYRKRNLPDPGNININLYIKPVGKPDAYAAVLAEKLVEDLQQRKPYRRAMRLIIQKAIRAGVKGIKVQVAGRLNGADIARSEELRQGPVPLQTLRADIDYSSKSAKTIFGLLGVKIWVFHGERLSPLKNFS
uniref:Small ribosomal subunit protein uS3c n=1 Tax=Dicloster acuatus TaxID=91190 RepID=A0A097KQJ7_9CHLO|nr:ribosomal protein S3 [Dicloster acuatus]AIT95451.1 ribosomal protein S3 [Dicloster acuatus]